MKKVLLVLLTVLIASLHASATTPPTLSIEGFSIKAGETKELLVDLNNPDDQIANVQFLLNLPTGLTVAQKDGKSLITLTNRASGGHQVMDNPSSGMVMVYSMPVAAFSGTSGAILSITLTAGTGFAGGNIALRSIVLATEQGGQYKPDDVVYTIENKVPVTGITLNATSQELNAGQTFQLSATVAPSNATNKSVKWSSNKTSVATVSSTGVVTAVAAGSATITCEAQDGSGVMATCNITVKPILVTEIILNATNLELTVGQTFQLKETLVPSEVSWWDVKWSSNNTSVATVVDAHTESGAMFVTGYEGLVEARAPGSATITCSAMDGSGVTATCQVTVKAASESHNIQFADAEVKRICVENWDTNGDGELSKDEAAAVKSIGRVFKGNEEIVSFIELEYFREITSIESSAFSGCVNLEEVVIPENVTSISSSAFYRCLRLQNIVIPRNVVEIASGAFSVCKDLSTITVESGNSAYDSRNNCNAIIRKSDNTLILGCQNTIIPNSVTSIGYGAFDNSNLSHIVIPASVSAIGDRAFFCCSELSTIIVDSGNLVYDSRNNCNAIIRKSDNTLIVGSNSTVIPNSVTCIGEEAFYLRVSMPSITIPNSVTSIRDGAFEYCYALTTIKIPESVVDLGENVFWGSDGITSVTVEWPIPIPYPKNFNWDSQIAKSTLYVPAGSKSAYQQAAGWKNFRNIVEMEADGPELVLTDLTINGDGIVGSLQHISVTIKNEGGDFSGNIYIHSKSDYENKWDFYSTQWVIPQNGQKTLNATVTFTMSDTFRLWVSTDEAGNDRLGDVVTWTVTPAAVLTAKDYTREYGEENPDFGYTADKGGFSGTPKITCTADRFSDVGTYDIVIEQGSVDNNYVTLVPGTLTITKAPLTVKAMSYFMRQEGQMPDYAVEEYTGFKNGDNERSFTKGPQFQCAVTPSSAMGDYTIYVSGIEAKNYQPSYVNGFVRLVGRAGDVNRDTYVNTTDVVDVIQYILGKPSLQAVYDGDLNLDDQITMADAASVIYCILNNDRAAARRTAPTAESHSQLGLSIDEQGRLAVTLQNNMPFVAFQFDVTVPEGTNISKVLLSDLRKDGHQVASQRMDGGCYRVLAYSMQNNALRGNDGVLATLQPTMLDGEVTLSNIHFADADGIDYLLPDVSLNMMTGISTLVKNSVFDIYDLNGRLVRRNATSTKGLQRGVYMINNNKVVIK